MANASAKKSAVAKAQVQQFYFPLLIIVNLVYIALRWRISSNISNTVDDETFKTSFLILNLTKGECFIVFCILVGQVYAYHGIIESAVAMATASGGKTNADLVGGSNLDLLAILFFVQFTGGLYSSSVYWLLIGLPVWGAYTLYLTFYGSGNMRSSSHQQHATNDDDDDDDELKDRRQKRSERRRQKRQ